VIGTALCYCQYVWKASFSLDCFNLYPNYSLKWLYFSFLAFVVLYCDEFHIAGETKNVDWCNLDFPKAEVFIINFTSTKYFLPLFIGRMPNLRALIYSATYACLYNISVFKSLSTLRSLWLEKVPPLNY